MGLIRSSLKETSTSGGVRAATVARERLGIGALSSTAGEMRSTFNRGVIFSASVNLLHIVTEMIVKSEGGCYI
jgi:hypothetical protein